jgi:hypothetical protein
MAKIIDIKTRSVLHNEPYTLTPRFTHIFHVINTNVSVIASNWYEGKELATKVRVILDKDMDMTELGA